MMNMIGRRKSEIIEEESSKQKKKLARDRIRLPGRKKAGNCYGCAGSTGI